MKYFFAFVVRLMTVAAVVLTLSLPAIAAETGKQIYDRLVAIDKKFDADVGLAIAKGDYELVPKLVMRDPSESIALEGQLKSRALKGDAESAFYWGVYKYSRGVAAYSAVQRATTETDAGIRKKLGDEYFVDAMTGLKIASKSGIGDASWNIAQMYENGFGVSQSQLAAAEWYAKAGAQYVKQGLREVALAALERAEAIDAKIPDAVRLRALLYPQGKK